MITLYGLKNCDTCKKARNWLDRFSIAYEFVDYRDTKPTPETLLEWKNKAGDWAALINKASTTWRSLSEARKSPSSDAEWKLLLREYPQLIKRPVLILQDGSLHQGFSDNNYKKIFNLGK